LSSRKIDDVVLIVLNEGNIDDLVLVTSILYVAVWEAADDDFVLLFDNDGLF
jgi:hypothetical protein